MVAFASDRRAGWVRVLVLILCALFIFAVIATPPAFAISETVALFTAASVLSAAVAALGFKLSSDAEGQATLNQMVKDFAAVSWAIGLVAVGDKVNGLLNGVQYIKMQVLNGKTYLDQRIVAWCQQWLSNNSTVYSSSSFVTSFRFSNSNGSFVMDASNIVPISQIPEFYKFFSYPNAPTIYDDSFVYYGTNYNQGWDTGYLMFYSHMPKNCQYFYQSSYNNMQFGSYTDPTAYIQGYISEDAYFTSSDKTSEGWKSNWKPNHLWININSSYAGVPAFSNYGSVSGESNTSGLSGTDTIGADYKDKTLDQILDGLKDWAQDWYDAGADSATNTVVGAKDLPLTVGEQAASANPALNPDVVYNPPFALPLPDVRSGETTAGTITAGQENAAAAETATADVAENQTVINSLVSWALNYIDPDTGLFSKFPLCVPYDAYLLVTSSLGVDAVGSDSIFGASPGDLDGVVTESIDSYSDFQPIINIDHDFELDGATYPISISIDLSPWQPFVTFFREGMALLLVAELIGSEYKRIRGH